MTKPTLYFAEDDKDINSMVSDFLISEGFAVQSFLNGTDLLDQLTINAPDILLIDYMLPDMTGVEICQRCKPDYQGPIVMLTAHDNDLVEIASINQGVNSFLIKPVRPHVLLAHIKSQLKNRQITAPNSDLIRSGALLINTKQLSAQLDGISLDLSDAEFSLLALLAKNAGKIFSRDDIFSALRGIEYDGLDRSIDMRISVLRQKLKDQSTPYKYIKTVRGKGYMFIAE